MRKPNPPSFTVQVVIPATALGVALLMVHIWEPRWLPQVVLIAALGVSLALGAFGLACMNYREKLRDYRAWVFQEDRRAVSRRVQSPPRRKAG